MAKSKIGYLDATFFGYLIKDDTYQLTQERKDSVTSLVFPLTKKQAQSFLGCTVFFRNNIVNFAHKSAPLHSMTANGFSWDKATWEVDYEKLFEDFKVEILNSIAVAFPDYSLNFILRTDASKVAWGGVLIQVKTGGTYECISLVSAKFSDTALKWDIQKKEAYAIYASIKKMSNILTGKYFVIETDNKNITFLESNETDIFIRWRLYIQTFHNCVRFLLGK